MSKNRFIMEGLTVVILLLPFLILGTILQIVGRLISCIGLVFMLDFSGFKADMLSLWRDIKLWYDLNLN